MFEKIFSEYGLLAVCVIAGVAIVFNMFFPTLRGIGEGLNDFVNSYNN